MRRRHAAVAAVAIASGAAAVHAHRPAASEAVDAGTVTPLPAAWAAHQDRIEASRDEPLPTTTVTATTTTAAARRATVAPIPVRTIAPAAGTWRVSSTAFCLDGTMADGRHTHPGAVAGNIWPLGTRLDIPGFGVETVEDRIGSGSQLDIWMASCAQAVAYGRREITVTEAAA